MSRLTGNDAKGLMEAYSAVYAPQELTEEQVWEEVENWVNSLLEEGYDLSDYTWEEAYEAYFQLDEVAPLAIPAAMAAAPYVLPALGVAAGVAKGLMNRNRTKNTPDEERFLNTGSFASSKETVAQRNARLEALRQRAAKRSKTTSVSTPTQPAKPTEPTEPAKPTSRRLSDSEYTPNVVRSKNPQSNINPQPKPPEKPPESPKPPAKPPETTPGQSSTSSTGNTGSATGGSGGRKPKPEGPNWAQRQLTNFQQGRAQEKGAGTAERLGRVIGSGEKITKGSAEWAAKNLLAKPLGIVAGGGLAGGIAYGAAKGTETLAKKFGPGIMKWAKGVVNPNLRNDSYDMNRDEVIIECLNLIANHLIEGKYASNEKGALKIMENMSDGWALNILGNYLEE